MWYQGTLADVTVEKANQVPSGVAHPIGALAAHILHCEDGMINMGIAYYHKGDYDRAIECYQKAVAIKPDEHEAWFNIGCACSLKGDALMIGCWWRVDQAR